MKRAIITLVLSFTILEAGEKIVEFRFDPSHVKLGERKGYVTVFYEDYGYVNPFGAPMLPSRGVAVLIPASSVFKGYEIVSMDTKSIGRGYKVFPQQKPVPISFKVHQKFIEPLDSIYKRDAFYPTRPIKFSGEGNMSGFRLVNFLVYPVIYNPVSGEIKVVTHVVMKVKYEEGKRAVRPITREQMNLIRGEMRGIVINPEDIDLFAPPLMN